MEDVEEDGKGNYDFEVDRIEVHPNVPDRGIDINIKEVVDDDAEHPGIGN